MLVEGFKEQQPAEDRGLAARRRQAGARYPDDDFVAAIATDAPDQLPEPTLRPVLDLNDPDAVGRSGWSTMATGSSYDPENYA